jgi:hypothetical protein
MEDVSGRSSMMVFDHFRKGNYDAVLDMLDKAKDGLEKHEEDEALLEYYKEGCKDPKKAYKVLSEIENEDKHEPF